MKFAGALVMLISVLGIASFEETVPPEGRALVPGRGPRTGLLAGRLPRPRRTRPRAGTDHANGFPLPSDSASQRPGGHVRIKPTRPELETRTR